MKMPLAFMLLALTAALAAVPPKNVRLVSKDGRSIEAEIVSVGGKSAKIRKADGKEFEIAFDNLKPESVEALKKAAPATAPAAPVPTADKSDRPLPKGKPATPADLPEKVVVKTGEEIFVTFTQVASGLTKPVVTKEVAKGTPHFTVDFQVRKEGDEITMAIVKQFYDKTVKVKCLARNKGQTEYYPTSILPLFTGLFGGETWGDDVEELVFYDFAWSDQKLK